MVIENYQKCRERSHEAFFDDLPCAAVLFQVDLLECIRINVDNEAAN